MSTCARCGVEFGNVYFEADDMKQCPDRHSCRDRELANLRSLLRSVTRRLERASQHLADGMPHLVEREIDAVLEALS